MTTSNGSDNARIEAELRSLDQGARDVLTSLAVCGRASLSVEQLGEITKLSDLLLTLAELERRGLVVLDGDRVSLAPPARGPLRRLLDSVDAADRVLQAFIRIAEDDRVTLDDLDAVLELTRIAAQTGRWSQLLRLAEAAETTLSTTNRVQQWIEVVERRREAARELGDGDAVTRAERELERLRARGPAGPRTVLYVLAALATGAVGVGAGYLLGNGTSGDSTETVTAAVAGAETVTETITETETVAETITETETVTEQPPAPPVD